MISLHIDTPDPVQVGEQLAGYAVWTPEGERARAVRVRFGWRTEGRGDRDQGALPEMVTPLTEGAPAWPVSFPFTFTVPPAGPVSYHGRLLRVIWEVTARLDVPLGKDPTAVQPVVVVPRFL